MTTTFSSIVLKIHEAQRVADAACDDILGASLIDPASILTPEELAIYRAGQTFVGQLVKVIEPDCDEESSPARIIKIYENGTIRLKWEDGDEGDYSICEILAVDEGWLYN